MNDFHVSDNNIPNRTRQAKRGYNLVEMGIALAVLGLLLGALVVPMQVRFELEDRHDTEQMLADAMLAVSGYALSHRTAQWRVLDRNGIIYTLPAGRPYLPCPDITGDGEEDREPITHVVTAPIALTTDVMTTEGVCTQTKGLLPWRTLGLQEQNDPWGRRLGYRVDLAFSSQIMGFDETFRADMFDPRQGIVVNAAGVARLIARADRNQSGALVCSRLPPAGAADHQPGCPATTEPNNLIAGIVTGDAIVLGLRSVPAYSSINRVESPQGIIDGAAYVVFSHGKNGYGGINRENNRCLRDPSAATTPTDLAERANAFYATGHPMLAAPFSCTDFAAHPELAENLFVSPEATGTRPTDDLLVWASPNLLFGELLRGGALPIPKLPFLEEER